MSGTQDALIGIDFGGGLDQNVDPKRVIAARMLELDNVRLVKRKQISKRFGYSKVRGMLNGGSPIVCSILHSLGPKPIVIEEPVSGNTVYSRMWAPSSDRLALRPASYGGARSQSAYVEVHDMPGITGAGDISLCDSAVSGEYTCQAWQQSTGVWFRLINNSTGAVLCTPVSATGSRPRVMAFNFTFVLGYVNTATNNLEFRTMDPTTATTMPSAVISTLGLVNVAQPVWDWAWFTGSDTAIVAYNSSTATTIRIASINSGAVTSGATSFAVGGTIDALTICEPNGSPAGNNDCRVVWHDTTQGLRLRYFNSSPFAPGSLGGANHLLDATVTAVENIAAIYGAASGNEFCTVTQYTAAATYNRFCVTRNYTDAAPPVLQSPQPTQRAIGLASKLVVRSNRVFGLGVHESALQRQFFLFEWGRVPTNTQFPHARFLFGEAGGLTTAPHLPRMSLYDSSGAFPGTYSVAVLKIARVFVDDNAFATIRNVVEVRVDFNKRRGREVEIADSGLVAGGHVALLDGGQGLIENGFWMGPENLSTVVALAGGSLADGTYQHIAYYEFIDDRGRVHRSAASPPVTSVVSGGGGAGRITVTYPALRVTRKVTTLQQDSRYSEVRVVVCRTEANGKVFYRVNGTPASSINTATADTSSFVDNMSNATLITQEPSYTQPSAFSGQLDNYAPNSCQAICASPTRVFVADGSTIYFSKLVEDNVAVSFSLELFVSLPSEGGPITALAYQDGKIYAAKRGEVWAFGGEGPDNTGAGGSFSEPYRIASADGGCVDQAACVATPAGILMVDMRGVYQLGRDESWTFVGKSVRDSLTGDGGPGSINAAVLVPESREVRFLAAPYIYTYNYEFVDDEGIGAWSRSTFNALDMRVIDRGLVNGITWANDEIYTIASPSGEFYYEQDGALDDGIPSYTDASIGNFTMQIGTGWVNVATIQGFQLVKRLLILGQFEAATTINVYVLYDYEDYSLSSTPYIITAANASPNGDVLQFEIQLRKQKCEALRVIIRETSSDAGFSLTAMSLLVGLKPKQFRLPSGRRAK